MFVSCVNPASRKRATSSLFCVLSPSLANTATCLASSPAITWAAHLRRSPFRGKDCLRPNCCGGRGRVVLLLAAVRFGFKNKLFERGDACFPFESSLLGIGAAALNLFAHGTNWKQVLLSTASR